ncbi:ATP-binding SpoIIE family protein phosphatase [Nocardioides rubriscoriae]|uniref:ATP-binding SpoIIE family protein phosphatase n=1 Tax=Nocardioides rubriscoriae TaxID=642762 RepID=UPI0011E04172|nr:ATP-binding protein [Nocardioides rubriscoriae]
MTDDDLDEFTAALHDVVLPVSVPVLPGLDLAAHFSVPAEPGEATGAWFDVVRLRSGRVALSLGQVPGSGLAVVAAAGSVSAVLRAGLLCHEDVVEALRLATLYAEHSPGVAGTTAVVAVVDPATHELTYATAGHPGPLVAPAGAPARALDPTALDRLGSGAEPVAVRHRLHDGDVLLLSSQVEAVDTAQAGEGDLALLDRTRVPGDVSATCTAYAAALGEHQARGAVAVVAAEVSSTVHDALDLDLVVDDSTSRAARGALGDWLEALGATPTDVLSLIHASAELVANAAEHAYAGGTPGTVGLHASQSTDGEITVEVTDTGRWSAAVVSDVSRGRGLAMAAGLVDDLLVTHDDQGTRARLRHRLTRPVLVDRVPADPARPADEPLVVERPALGVVRLSGALGHDEVDQLTYALLLASQGRTQALDVDLSEVTALSAGGLTLLGDLVRPDGAPDPGSARAPVTLLARRGSVSQVELERAGIAHRAS